MNDQYLKVVIKNPVNVDLIREQETIHSHYQPSPYLGMTIEGGELVYCGKPESSFEVWVMNGHENFADSFEDETWGIGVINGYGYKL